MLLLLCWEPAAFMYEVRAVMKLQDLWFGMLKARTFVTPHESIQHGRGDLLLKKTVLEPRNGETVRSQMTEQAHIEWQTSGPSVARVAVELLQTQLLVVLAASFGFQESARMIRAS